MRQRILIPLDGSKFAEEAIKFLQFFFAPEKCEVYLLTVLFDISQVENIVQFSVLSPELQEAAKAAQRQQEQLTRAYLDMIAWGLEDVGYRVQTHIAFGQPEVSIVHIALALDVDLLLMTSHGQGRNVQWRYGTVARRVIDACACPTLIVPVREKLLKGEPPSKEKVMLQDLT